MPQVSRGSRGAGPLRPDTTSPLSYKVLALKYRPTSFDEVVGQTNVTRTLRNALERGKVGHAFLLSGARGVGKTTTARILAKALNCSRAEGPTANPCSTRTDEDRAKACDSCREIADGHSLDVQEIDGASNNSVDQVRELRESARYNPARDRFKVWIIDEVHMLSTGAFNALLKTLEEPPPQVKFIFATTEYHKIPETILSRCQQYDFRMIPARELQLHLRNVADQEKIQVSDAALALIARVGGGQRPRRRSRSSTRCWPSPGTRSPTPTWPGSSASWTASCCTAPRRRSSRATASPCSTSSRAWPTTGPTTATSRASCSCTCARSCS